MILKGDTVPLKFYYITPVQGYSQNQPFCFFVHFGPLNQVKKPPKLHRLFRTCISPVGAFDCIKFGQPGGKIKVRKQCMYIAKYTKIRVIGYNTAGTNISHLSLIKISKKFPLMKCMHKAPLLLCCYSLILIVDV